MRVQKNNKAFAYRVPIGDYNYLQCELEIKVAFCQKDLEDFTSANPPKNSLDENTPNYSKNFSTICLSNHKSFEFLKKNSL